MIQLIPTVVQQHAEEAVTLRTTRSYLVTAAHVQLFDLARADERLAAHLDGLAVAGDEGSKTALDAVQEDPDPGLGEFFTAMVCAIEDRNEHRLEWLLDRAEASPQGRRGVISAFGWVSTASLQAIGRALLASPRPFRREVGLAACAMHRVEAGEAITQALQDADAALRARALRAAASAGRVALLPLCSGAMADADACCAYEAARAAALLGERRAALEALERIALAPGPWQCSALMLLLKLHAPETGRRVLGSLPRNPEGVRLLIRGAGVAGDAQYVPWLISQMSDDKLARLAGEAFSFITGLDLSEPGFYREPPEDVETGPTEDAEDEDVSLDEDEDLPWPDPARLDAWWRDNASRFTPGARYFVGAPPSPPHGLGVLRHGYQRQRIAAAQWLCLLQPGTPLFNTATPAWRQKRWLNAMEAKAAALN